MSRFADGYGESQGGQFWVLDIVLSDGHAVSVRAAQGRTNASAKTLAAIRQVAACYQIPAELTGTPPRRDGSPVAVTGDSTASPCCDPGKSPDHITDQPPVGDPAPGAAGVTCLECGAESAGAAQVCARCGAPVAQQQPAADAAADGPGDSIPLPHELVGQQTGRGSRRNALIIVGITAALLAVSLIAELISVGSSTSTSSTSTSPPVQLTEDQLQPGDCLVGSDLGLDTSSPWPDLFTAVPCTQPHIAEVFFAGNAWSQSLAYPGDAEVWTQADDRCGSAFQAYVAGRLQYIAGFTYDYITPDDSTWPSGDRLVVCIAYKWTPQYPGGAPVNYSIKGSHR